MKPSARTNQHQKHKTSATNRGWVVYCRVSTEEQATGHSLDNQKRLCVEWLQQHNFSVRQVITDAGESGSKLKRPGISSLQDLLDQGVVAGVVVTKLDRLSRSLRDVLTLTDRFKRENADFQCISQTIDSRTATGKMHLHFLAVFADRGKLK